MPRRILDESIDLYLKEYFDATGAEYDHGQYASPDTVPANVLSTVKAIKLIKSDQRQLEIKAEVDALPRSGDVVIVPEDREHLIDEFDLLVRESKKWSAV